MKSKRCALVAGGAGFIGSHLVDKLLKDGNKVICLDNFYTGQKSNIKHLLDNREFSLIEHDINNTIQINEKVDTIYNLACPASPVHYQKAPIFTITTNFIGTRNLLDFALKNNAIIFQASTSEVYGNPLKHPQDESYWGNVNTIGTRSCYDEGKRIAETLCFDYNRKHGIDIRVARIFNTYGPRMAKDDGRVISNFIVQALLGLDITIYGDGSQTRSFQYIDDLIDGICRTMNQDFVGPINLGSEEECTILELAKKIINLTNSNSKIVNKPLPLDDPIRRRPNIDKAKQILKWEPNVSLHDGLIETINFFKSNLKT